VLVSSLKREYHSTEATLQEVTVRVLEGSTVAMRTLFPASLHDSGYASCRSARLSHLPRGLAAGKRIKPCPEISEAAVARPVCRLAYWSAGGGHVEQQQKRWRALRPPRVVFVI